MEIDELRREIAALKAGTGRNKQYPSRWHFRFSLADVLASFFRNFDHLVTFSQKTFGEQEED